jgi:hypothetical protein
MEQRRTKAQILADSITNGTLSNKTDQPNATKPTQQAREQGKGANGFQFSNSVLCLGSDFDWGCCLLMWCG